MGTVGARHPNVLFAPDHFAGWSGADDKAAMTAALENLARLPNAYLRISSTSLGPSRRPDSGREGPVPARYRSLHPAAGHVGL